MVRDSGELPKTNGIGTTTPSERLISNPAARIARTEHVVILHRAGRQDGDIMAYAKLVVRIGVNVQFGQRVVIRGAVEHARCHTNSPRNARIAPGRASQVAGVLQRGDEIGADRLHRHHKGVRRPHVR